MNLGGIGFQIPATALCMVGALDNQTSCGICDSYHVLRLTTLELGLGRLEPSGFLIILFDSRNLHQKGSGIHKLTASATLGRSHLLQSGELMTCWSPLTGETSFDHGNTILTG